MSIFPKRTIPGKPVTIHWFIGMVSPSNTLQFAFVQLGVKSPDGKVTYLFEENVLLLPESYESSAKEEKIDAGSVEHNLPRNTPILVLADYLSGRRKKEELVQILKRIRSSRHFYFIYPVPKDALLGRYELVSELYLDGVRHPSLTAEEDFFLVERVTVENEGDGRFTVRNDSSEPVPVKIMEYTGSGVSARLENVPPLGKLTIEVTSEVAYLLYNEEREVIPLFRRPGKRILRSPSVQNVEKTENGSRKVYVLPPDSDDAYILEDSYLKIWDMADGTALEETLKAVDGEAYSAMAEAKLMTNVE